MGHESPLSIPPHTSLLDQCLIMYSLHSQSLPKLFNMRRRGEKANEIKDPLIKPDIRTLFILFLLSFISTTTPTPLKSSLLEDHKDLFIGIFKGIHDDPYEIVQYVLEISWDGVWCDGKIARTTKLRVFGEGTLAQVCPV